MNKLGDFAQRTGFGWINAGDMGKSDDGEIFYDAPLRVYSNHQNRITQKNRFRIIDINGTAVAHVHGTRPDIVERLINIFFLHGPSKY